MNNSMPSTTKQTISKGSRWGARLTGLVLMLVVLCASSVWLASAQKPEEGGDVPSVPPVGPALRPKIDPALLKQLAEGDARHAHVIVEVIRAADLTTAIAVSDP